MDFEILRILQDIRNPILNVIFNAITYLGSGSLMVAIVIVAYWCFNKKLGLRLGFGMVLSGMTIQILKITFRVDRPWVKDSSIIPDAHAKKSATGYSFPSGHTNQVTSIFSGISYYYTSQDSPVKSIVMTGKKHIFRCVCGIVILFVAFSRLYLGVHTPTDVIVSFLVTFVIVMLSNIIFDRFFDNVSNIKWGALFITVCAVAGAIYTACLYTNNIIDIDYAKDSIKLCGAAVGFAVGWFIESNFINFNEKGIGIFKQIIKVVIGLITTLAIKEIIKVLGITIFGEMLLIDFVRYVIVILWAIGIYPIIIKKFFHIKEN